MWLVKRAVTLIAFASILEAECSQENGGKMELYFSFITSIEGLPTSSGGIPVIDFALEQINNDTRLLSNYTLKYSTVLDSKVSCFFDCLMLTAFPMTVYMQCLMHLNLLLHYSFVTIVREHPCS